MILWFIGRLATIIQFFVKNLEEVETICRYHMTLSDISIELTLEVNYFVTEAAQCMNVYPVTMFF